MLDGAIQFLSTADDFELEAIRQFGAKPRSPNWTNTYLRCLGDARRQRTAARKLVVLASKDSRVDATARGDEGAKCFDEIRSMTLEQFPQLAATARSSPAGSQRMLQAAKRRQKVAALLQRNEALAQLLWWCVEVEPAPPGRPVIDIDKREHAQ